MYNGCVYGALICVLCYTISLVSAFFDDYEWVWIELGEEIEDMGCFGCIFWGTGDDIDMYDSGFLNLMSQEDSSCECPKKNERKNKITKKI